MPETNPQMRTTIGYFIGTHKDWGGASRALLNFAKRIDQRRFQPIVLVTRHGPLVEELAQEHVQCLVWGTHDRGRNLARYAKAIWDAAQLFRRHALDVLHVNEGSIGWKPAEILAARALRIPVINHLHVPYAQP